MPDARAGTGRLYRSDAARPGDAERSSAIIDRSAREPAVAPPGARHPSLRPRHELLQAPRLLLLQPARGARGVLREPRRRRRCRTTPRSRIKALGLNGKGKVRINKAGCLDRCEEGPVLVVYPGGGLVHLRRPRRHRRDHRPARRRAARSSSGCGFDAEDDRALHDRRSRRRARGRAQRPRARAARHRAGRASASAAGRHARQQGRADAREDVLRAGLRRACASISAASARSAGAFDDGVGETEDALAALALRAGALRLGDALPVVLAGFSFGIVRADARRAGGRRASAWCWSGPRCGASPSTPCPPTRSSSTARRTTSCRSPTCSPGRGRRSCRSSCFPGCGHFFHGRLPQLQRMIAGMWHGHAVAPGA